MFGGGPEISVAPGHSTYTTGLGTFFTLGAATIVILYIIGTFRDLFDTSAPTITTLTEYDIDKTEYTLLEAGGKSDILPVFAVVDQAVVVL
jgi:hypothetical protein